MRVNASAGMRSGEMERQSSASDGGAPERSAWLRAGLPARLRLLGTPPRRIARSVICEGCSGEASLKNSRISCTSQGTSDFGRGRRSIRKNIIGHAMRPGAWRRTGHGLSRGVAVRGKQALAQGVLGSARRPFALLDQPAREHGAGVFFHPLIEQRADLLAEIGGMGKTRKFVALERIPRSREKKLPRRLGWGTGHDSLLRIDACNVIHQ